MAARYGIEELLSFYKLKLHLNCKDWALVVNLPLMTNQTHAFLLYFLLLTLFFFEQLWVVNHKLMLLLFESIIMDFHSIGFQRLHSGWFFLAGLY